MNKLVTKIVDKIGFVLATCIVFAALLVSITRLLTPVLMGHRADFEKFVSAEAGRPVMIREINIRWHGYQPEISLEDVTILDLQEQTPTLKLSRLEVDFNIWRSIWNRKLFIQNLTVSGIELTIHHLEKGQFEVAQLGAINMQDTSTGHSVHADLMFNWIFSQPRLALQDIEVHYIPANYPPRSITLKSLSLRNSPTHHVIDGSATLNQEMPVNVDVHLGWDGDIRKLPEANGHVYLYFEGLSLPQWFGKLSWQGLHISQGLASTKLWVRWNKNKVYKMQNTFEVYNLELYSSVTKNAQMINRISGNLGWKTDGNVQTFAGDQIYLDLPKHLWPVTTFTVQATADADNNLTLNNVKFNYLDLKDVKRFLLMTALVSDAQREQLLLLGVEGEVQDLQAQLPTDLTDWQHYVISGNLQHFNLDAWQQVPAIRNFSAIANWNGKIGNLTLACTNTGFNAKRYYTAPVSLKNLNGGIDFSRDDAGVFTIHTTNLHVDSADLALDVKADATLPLNDSPTLNINAKYSVSQMNKLAAYLPLKIMDPDLATWLKNAFGQGKIDVGTAVIQGNLKDFPFEANNGKFLMSISVKDLDFNYAPHWPHLLHVNGDMVFAGSAMKVDIHSANLLNIPVQNVHGEIPYIGDKGPQIINIDTTINTDLANGLLFIRQSPLQKTIGKDFNGVTLAGPMELKLALSIPAKTPDNSKILGTINTSNGTMALPAWNLTIAKLTGVVTFTENSLSAANLQSELFGAPAAINIATTDKTGQISINLNSTTSVTTLQNWLNLSFNNIVQGTTDYQLQLLLSPAKAHTSDQLLINSNLQGVEINLPAPYAKKAQAPTVFQAAIDLGESKYLKVKFSYAKLMSAAFALSKENQQLTLYSGEIKLGSDTATWQTASGILVSGQTPELDVAIWQDYFSSLGAHDKTKPQNNFKLLRGIDLSANLLRVMNLSLHNANVKASMTNTAWDIQMSSNEIGGNLTLPFNLSGATINGHLNHLTLDSKMATSKTARLDPRTLPALVFTIDNASYDDMKFGHVNLNLQPVSNGMEFKELSINEPNLQLNATGVWTPETSKLQGTIATPHVSDVLRDWGFNSANLMGSTANFNFNLSWKGPPYAPTLGGLTGTLNLKFGEGKIINLSDSTNSKIGLGKLLNIFSLSSIPRHLSFNSKDTAAGFNFDSMVGDFTFRNGSAFTENMRIEGPVAGIAIKGRIGLQAKDLDLHIGVNAHVTGSLPLVAAFAGGPVVGIATLVVDKVVTSQMSKVTTYDYTVTNSWANPVWQKAGGGK